VELGGAGKTFLLTEYVGRDGATDVSDPYGAALDTYRQTFDELTELVGRVADRLVAQQQSGDHR
jgi:protein-tyrosine-phosphatase